MSLLRARRIRSAGFVGVILGATLVVALGAMSSGSRVAARGAQQLSSQQPDANGIAPEGLAQIEALLREKETRSPAERKIDSQLLYARRMQQGLPVAPGVQRLEVQLPYAPDGHLILDVKANVNTNLLAQLNGLTTEVKKTSPSDVQLHVDLDQIEAIAARPEVVWVQPEQSLLLSGISVPPAASRLTPAARRAAVGNAVRRALAPVMSMTMDAIATGQGSVTSQADITHRAALFRGLTGFDGTGVKIGVLSNGVANLASAQASGDLGTVTVLRRQVGTGDEGTAMLELIHDIAPGAQLYFATATTSIVAFAQNIRDLRLAGCDIIVDNGIFSGETPFQDGQAPSVLSPTNAGVVIQAVKDVTASGALYFSAAGNEGNLTDGTSGVWEGDFSDGGPTAAPLPAGNLHNFAAAQPFDNQTVLGSGNVSLFWSDPLGGSANDYDLFRMNAAGTTVIASSTNIQSGTQDPVEQMASQSTANPRLVVVKKTTAAARYLHLNTNRGRLSVATSGQTHGHNSTSAPYSFGVAATPAVGPYPNPFSTSNVVEVFSSDGPRRIFFNADGTAITPGNLSSTGGLVLQKPDLTAADGLAITGAGGVPRPFSGTSAAAPTAAAIAALFKSQNPSFTQAQLKTLLLSTVVDIGAPGVDRDSGAGIVMAVAPQPSCTFTMAAPVGTVPVSGGSGSVGVSAALVSCNWVAWSTVSWITVSGGGVGTGDGSIAYTVAPNPGPARSGTIMIQGGHVVSVVQAGTPATTFDTTTPVFIRDLTTVESPLSVYGLTGPITNLSVSLYLTHTFDADLSIELIGPDATRIDLSIKNGSSGDNYGGACTPLGARSTFDDSATTLVTSGAAPFVGRFRPEQPLSTFNGKSGTAANGTWKLRITDDFQADQGTLQCWSLHFNQPAGPPPPAPVNLGVFRPSTGRWFLTGQPAIDWGVAGDLPVPGDYNGDGIRDVAVFRPSNGTWYIRGGATVFWGMPGDIPVPADYNGDGMTDIAVFRPSTGMFFIRNIASIAWGAPGDLPVVGDYNGDRIADVAVFRPSTGTWYIRNVTTAVHGFAADIPVPADYNGDGITDIAVFRPATGTWIVKDQYWQGWGLPGDVPVPMDRDGDGRAELGVFRRATGTWYFKNHLTDAVETAAWGGPGDIPLGRAMPPVQTLWGDYDGDRKADLTVFRPSTGDWVSLRSLSGMTDFTIRTWGLSSDVPVGRDYDGDGKIDPAVFRPSTRRWFLLQSSTNYSTYTVQDFGLSTDKLVPADYDGDGKADVAVFRPSLGRWMILLSSTDNTVDVLYDWGLSSDIPMPADFDGDGIADLALFSPSTGTWSIFNRITGAITMRDWGLTGDIPVAADYDGDGRADFAVFRPSLGRWLILLSSTNNASYLQLDWGLTGDVPVPADYDADGKADVAVFRPSDGTWYVRGLFNRSWGMAGDIPVMKNP